VQNAKLVDRGERAEQLSEVVPGLHEGHARYGTRAAVIGSRFCPCTTPGPAGPTMRNSQRSTGRVARSPVLASYSKAPEFAYTPALRTEIQNESRRVNREEIRKGMAWLQNIARADARAAAVVTGGGV